MHRIVFPTKNVAETKNFVFDYTSLLLPGEYFLCDTVVYNYASAASTESGIVYNPNDSTIWQTTGAATTAIIGRDSATGVIKYKISATSTPGSASNLFYDPTNKYIWTLSTSGTKYMKFDAVAHTELGEITSTHTSIDMQVAPNGWVWDVGPNTLSSSTLGRFSKFDPIVGTQTDYTTGIPDANQYVFDGSGNIWGTVATDSTPHYELVLFNVSSHTVTNTYNINLQVVSIAYCSARNSLLLACLDGGGTIREFSLASFTLTATNISNSYIQAPGVNITSLVDNSANHTFFLLANVNDQMIRIWGFKTTDLTQIYQNTIVSEFNLAEVSIAQSNLLISDQGSCYGFQIFGPGTLANSGTPAVNCTLNPCNIVVYSGVDPNPSAMLNGLPSYKTPYVTQSLTAGVEGVQYDFSCTVQTNLNRILTMSGFVAVPHASI